MKTLTIIGNGFDLGHNLPTGFDDFINSNRFKYSNKYEMFKNGENSWREVEKIYEHQLLKIIQNRSWQDVSEIVENIVQDYGLSKYGEVDFYNFNSDIFEDEFAEVETFISILTEFELDFQAYLKQHCGGRQLKKVIPRKSIGKILGLSARIISFNYTETVETVYGINTVEHIHGSVTDAISIGSGALDFAKESLVDYDYPNIKHCRKDKYGLQEMMFYYDYDDDGNRVENAFIKRFFDEVAFETGKRENELFTLLDVKNKDALESRIQTISSLNNETYDEVYIIGHSLGEADLSVFNAINKNANVVYFYHMTNELTRVQQTLNDLGLNYRLVSDEYIFI